MDRLFPGMARPPIAPPPTRVRPTVPRTTDTAEPTPATVPLSTVFCDDDADLIIRAAGVDFQAHKFLLSLASPIFRGMFTVPQPPTDTPSTPPHVDVHETAETWETILRIIYHCSPSPVIDDLASLESLLLAAKKYEMQFVLDSHKHSFRDRDFIQKDPLHLYAIACACGFEDQAKYVARNAEHLAVTSRPHAGNLEGLTVASYHRLVSFLAERDNEWNKILGNAPIPPAYPCNCGGQAKEGLYNRVKEDLKRFSLQIEEVYLRALEYRSRLRQPACSSTVTPCALVDSEVKGFIERMAKERESLCDRLMHDKQCVQRPPIALHPTDIAFPRFIKGI